MKKRTNLNVSHSTLFYVVDSILFYVIDHIAQVIVINYE